MYFHSLALHEGWLSPIFLCVTVFVERHLLVIARHVTLNQRRTFLVAFDGVLVASRMYVATFALLSCYERVFITKKIAYFMISELWTFGLQNLFVRTRETFFLTYEPSD